MSSGFVDGTSTACSVPSQFRGSEAACARVPVSETTARHPVLLFSDREARARYSFATSLSATSRPSR